MRKIKVLLLISLIVIVSFAFSSCRCYSSIFDWNISSIDAETLLSNGNTMKIRISHSYSEAYPITVHQGMTYIDIKWNNKVVFKPVDSDEELVGKYKVDYHDNFSTYFTITFENGEKTEQGQASTHALVFSGGNPFRAVMSFEFRGVTYNFRSGYDDTKSEKENQKDREQFIQLLRSGDNILKKGTVKLDNNSAKIYGDYIFGIEEFDELYRDGLKVIAVHVTSDNELIILDEIRDGECMFINYVNGYSNAESLKAYIIYYIDPIQ